MTTFTPGNQKDGWHHLHPENHRDGWKYLLYQGITEIGDNIYTQGGIVMGGNMYTWKHKDFWQHLPQGITGRVGSE